MIKKGDTFKRGKQTCVVVMVDETHIMFTAHHVLGDYFDVYTTQEFDTLVKNKEIDVQYS